MKRALLAASAASLFAIAAPVMAQTVSFTFQPCGNNTCAIGGLTSLDWQPGNVLAVDGAGGGAILPVGTPITDYYQANLNSALVGNAIGFAQGTDNVYLTVVAGFGEVVSPLSGGVTNVFTFDPANPTNFFRVYLNATGGNDLTGANFATGTLLLAGSITSVFSNVTASSVNLETGAIISAGLFDQFGTNQYGDTESIGVSGSANVRAILTTVNSAYFPDLELGDAIVAAFTTGNLLAPFQTVNPSSAFSSDGITSANFAHNIGDVNGISGPNFQFQADTSTVFQRAVPEPTSIALLGIALLGAAGAVRRKRSA